MKTNLPPRTTSLQALAIVTAVIACALPHAQTGASPDEAAIAKAGVDRNLEPPSGA
jgi:hypothetical protein